jgi:hypothetical protein
MRLAHLLAVAAAALPAIAAAQTVVPVDKFDAVELRGGGDITIRQGPVQRVTIVRGDPKTARVEVIDRANGGKLILSPCEGFCVSMHHFEVLVETPDLGGVKINGGGHIAAEGAFRPRAALSAAINGGGKIIVAAQNSLAASIYGGGQIRYVGQPTIATSIHGGGSVDPAR